MRYRNRRLTYGGRSLALLGRGEGGVMGTEHVELTREEGRQFMASLAGEVDEEGYPVNDARPGTDEDGACLACGTPLQLCGHRPRCGDPDCDGDAGHDGPHFQWVPE